MAKSTYTPHDFLWKKKFQKLLTYLSENKDSRFNKKSYARNNKIPRSSVYDMIAKLEKHNLIKVQKYGEIIITDKGLKSLQLINGGVESVRRECRKAGVLSSHYLKYELQISDKTNFRISSLKELNPLDIRRNRLINFTQYIIYFEDATIIIYPKKVIININDLIGTNVEENDVSALNKAVSYIKGLLSIGIKTKGAMVEEGHFARLKSHLSGYLEKIDDKYYLDLGKGRKFWIDHSGGKREDETNDKLVRERIDSFLDDAINSDALISDIDKVVKALGFVTKIECARLKSAINIDKPIVPNNKPDYFG